MTYLQLLTQLTAHLKRIPPAQAEQTWREVLDRYNVLPFALEDAPRLMVKEAQESGHRRTSLETVALQCFVRNRQGIDWWDIREIVKRTLESIGS